MSTEDHVCFCGPCSTRIVELEAKLAAVATLPSTIADLHEQIATAKRSAGLFVVAMRRYQISAETAEDLCGQFDKLRQDLKNTSRDYSELRESYDKLFDEHARLKESLNQAVHDYHHVNCIKVVHGPKRGYLHGPDDDSPYDVDGCRYCGRCHTAL